jgi:hypothetical protein
LSPIPSCSWDIEEDLEDVQRSDEYVISSPPLTPGLSWDSQCGSDDIFDTLPKSVFEDWDDPPLLNVVIEEDGAQTLLITPESSFYYPPTPRSFHFAPFSAGAFVEDNLPLVKLFDESEPLVDVPAQLKGSEGIRSKKGQMLFLDTTLFSSFGNDNGNTFALSAFVYSPADEVPLWAPRALMYGLDVPSDPLDCIYSAGDISPVGLWDEKLCSPVLPRPLRTAPCC